MSRKSYRSPKLAIDITAEDFDEAVQSNSGGCLIADAIKKRYPQFSRVTVDMATVSATDRKAGKRYTWLQTQPGQHMLLSFDQGWRPEGNVRLNYAAAVKVIPILRAGPGRTAQREQDRQARAQVLQAKQDAGVPLTRSEKISLAHSTKLLTTPERPTARGRADVQHHSDGHLTVHGGNRPKLGEAHPNLLRGRDRHFGAKMANPGEAFEKAVAAAVAAQTQTT